MQTLVERVYENKPLMLGAAVIAFLIAALLLVVIVRMVFGSRLRMPGSRARQARLGIVDAFDLDRQRQLIIVRRDNTEHLIMIGGPNDVLIESEIVRSEAREVRRDKLEGLAPILSSGIGFPEARIPAPMPSERQDLPRGFEPPSASVESVPVLPSPLPVPVAATLGEHDRPALPFDSPRPPAQSAPAVEAPPAPPPRAPTFPLPPRRPAPTVANRPPMRPLERAMRTEPAPPSLDLPEAAPPVLPPAAERVASPEAERLAPAELTAPPAQPPRPAPPPFLRPMPPRPARVLQRPAQGGSVASTPTPSPAPPPAEAPVAPPPPHQPPAAPPSQVLAASPLQVLPASPPQASVVSPPAAEASGPKDTLESLEEEMAKLLGRG